MEPRAVRIRTSHASAKPSLSQLKDEFCSKDTDAIAPYLWTMSMQSSSNVSALHRQKVKGREIVVSEDPKLHLVWHYNRIFIKPLVSWYCHEQFLYGLNPQKSHCQTSQAARGYLRTYGYLIRHQSDFRVAQDPSLQLVPEDLTWDRFCQLADIFLSYGDDVVSERYRYGEIRLTRLNFWIKIFLGMRWYQRVESQYSTYFARFYGPILFGFALVSVCLNSLQLIMAVEQVSSHRWKPLQDLASWCGAVCAIAVVSVGVLLFGLFLSKLTIEWNRALKDRWQTRRNASFSPQSRV